MVKAVYSSHRQAEILDFTKTAADNIHVRRIHDIVARTLLRNNQNIYVIKVLSTKTMKLCIHSGVDFILF